MTIKLGITLDDRQVAFCTVSCVLIVCALIANYLVFPAYDNLLLLRSDVRRQSEKYARLEENIKVGNVVDRRFAQIGRKAFRTQPDEITVSEFLRELEKTASLAKIMLANVKPMPVGDEGAYKSYGVRLSVAGKVQEILKFIWNVTNGDLVVELESFSLRGVQGGNRAECSASMRMIRLIPRPAGRPVSGRGR